MTTDPTETGLTETQKAYNVAQSEMFQLAAYGHHRYHPSGECLTDEGKRQQRDYLDRLRAAREQLEAALLRLVAEHAETFRGDWGVPAAWLRSLADDPAALSSLAVRPDERDLDTEAPAVSAVAAPATDGSACPDPIECTHEAALGEAQQQVRHLGLMVDEYGAGASALTDKLKRVRDLHRETCILAKGQVPPTAFTCGMCEVLDAPTTAVLPADSGRADTLRAEAALIRAHCPDHLDSNSAEGSWMNCHCDVADDMERRMAAEPAAEPAVTHEAEAGSEGVVAAIVAALQKRAGELSELAEEQMRPSLEERAQEWLEAADVARRAAKKARNAPAQEAPAPFTPPAHYRRDDGVDCCVHTIPVGPDSCRECRDLADVEPAAGLPAGGTQHGGEA